MTNYTERQHSSGCCLCFRPTGYSCSNSQSAWLTAKCPRAHTPFWWQRPERIFSRVIELSSQDIRQDKWHNRQRQRKTVTISGSKRITKSTKFTGVAKSKPAPKILSPAKSKFRKEKGREPSVGCPRISESQQPQGEHCSASKVEFCQLCQLLGMKTFPLPF